MSTDTTDKRITDLSLLGYEMVGGLPEDIPDLHVARVPYNEELEMYGTCPGELAGFAFYVDSSDVGEPEEQRDLHLVELVDDDGVIWGRCQCVDFGTVGGCQHVLAAAHHHITEAER